MSDRPLDRYRQAREDRRRAFLGTPALREVSPHVEQVTVELSFVVQGEMEHYSPQTHTFHPQRPRFFEISLPFLGVHRWGASISGASSQLIGARREQTSGVLDCLGQQSGDQYDGHRTLLQLHYHLTVAYKAKTEAAIKGPVRVELAGLTARGCYRLPYLSLQELRIGSPHRRHVLSPLCVSHPLELPFLVLVALLALQRQVAFLLVLSESRGARTQVTSICRDVHFLSSAKLNQGRQCSREMPRQGENLLRGRRGAA
jgi:hypothetical protein